MGSELSMAARAEITARYARAYRGASRADKGRMLDEVVAVTGWSRANARRRLVAAAVPRAVRPRKRDRARRYSYDATKVLQQVWAFSGGLCGKYLVVAMPSLLDALERHGELVAGKGRYSAGVRDELLSMSAATVDRYLAPAKARDPLRGKTTTKASPLLRTSIKVRKATDEVEAEPGFFEGDSVAHCGPTLKGEFARTENFTDVHTGWVFCRSVPNGAHRHVLGVLDQLVGCVPFEVVGLDFDNGSEFINHDVVGWAADRKVFFTRSRPYKKNDQACVESKNNHLVRRYAFYWRYDTPQALVLLNALWPLVCDRANYLTPTKKPTGWSTDTAGRRKRLYDAPRTPFDRLCDSGVLSPAQQASLTAYRDRLNPADLARRIQSLQDRLTALAREATLDLQAAATPKPLPDTARSVRLRKAS